MSLPLATALAQCVRHDAVMRGARADMPVPLADEDAAFVDVLNVLEKLGFVVAARWAVQRSLRNALKHEYPDDPARQAAVLAAAQAAARELTSWLHAIEERVGA